MNKFEIEGQQLAYLDIGEGPVLLFGHSYLWDSQMWAPQIEVLSQSYRCIVPDLWAHGESEAAPVSTHSLVDYAQHMLALMDHLEIEQFSVVGLSVGGMWGAELTSQAPQRVKSLVLMDTFIGLEPEVAHKKYFAMLDTISQVQAVPAPIVDAVVPLFFANDAEQTNPEMVLSFKQSLENLKGERAVEVARIGRMVFGRRDVIEDSEMFALPTLIAVGREDKPRPVFESYLMSDCITGSKLVEIPQAGHISALEQPEFVNQMLLDFLNQVHA
ncbi:MULTISPECIES: alpha/beta fold hydrolase [Vibrio]|jgi:pimeloyl-ACP methyl ester carboxylesterase|uniref:alpha/beta fold hydrolase n=1 Tax=Vibrio TaxID=662 RepID=UPI000BFFE35A|nr:MULTISPECIES: alpha/beta fold hydrolase [unclassified Vibrio]PHJ42344.1 2-succinyl-6-hydroxy-2,4-cyclohexadiene-1-carboxylate synthase [Vibrio sp. PID17_43]RIZ54597.1 2-succinyl-6-hydroxy-2,4-cyclohexadiene-1-carboxylate synthase [Vibrio sp. PID23_8]